MPTVINHGHLNGLGLLELLRYRIRTNRSNGRRDRTRPDSSLLLRTGRSHHGSIGNRHKSVGGFAGRIGSGPTRDLFKGNLIHVFGMDGVATHRKIRIKQRVDLCPRLLFRKRIHGTGDNRHSLLVRSADILRASMRDGLNMLGSLIKLLLVRRNQALCSGMPIPAREPIANGIAAVPTTAWTSLNGIVAANATAGIARHAPADSPAVRARCAQTLEAMTRIPSTTHNPTSAAFAIFW